MNRNLFLTLFLCSFFTNLSWSQSGTVSSGGTASYSVGQVVYSDAESASGSVNQGIQQPYEITVLLGDQLEEISLKLSVYPNPTTDQLHLNVENHQGRDYQYELYDLSGNRVLQGVIDQPKHLISLQDLAPASYLLQVFRDGGIIKTFKIIKF